ncbi:MAG: RibD family protein [Actinomycetota bacterium]
MTVNFNRPQTTVVLAMSVDGKITDATRSPARFGSRNDKAHLEKQIALADATLFGADTLRTYGTTLRVSSPELLQLRERQEKPSQPVQIVCSRSRQFDPNLRFFQQPVPRWLLTTEPDENETLGDSSPLLLFERILVVKKQEHEIDWLDAFQQLASFGWQRLAILGGGKLVASLFAADLIDEIWLTVCPLILGGIDAPTPVEGKGFLAELAPRLELLAVERIEQELLLHYRLQRGLHSQPESI